MDEKCFRTAVGGLFDLFDLFDPSFKKNRDEKRCFEVKRLSGTNAVRWGESKRSKRGEIQEIKIFSSLYSSIYDFLLFDSVLSQ